MVTVTTTTTRSWAVRLLHPGRVLAVQPRREIRMFTPREPHTNISQPDAHRLPNLPKVPMEQATFPGKPPKGTKDLYRMMGEEKVHTKLVLGQYGIVALSGGGMKHKHFEVIKNKINRYVDEETSFAFWRIDPPFKPVTSKGGKRMGGGKGSVKTYMTPVKAGRIIVEVGGQVDWDEVHPWLSRFAKLLPFEAMAVNVELLERLEATEKQMEARNTNPMTLEWFIRNNMLNCHRFLSPYDIKWFGKFTYKDRHNNLKWNLARDHKYGRK